jgi:RNA polymerase sigma factor (sigma-70 family)
MGWMADFDAFFAESYAPVVRSLTLAFGSRVVAEDAAQGAFEKAMRHWARVGQMDRPGTWVYVVAVRSGRRLLARDRSGSVEVDASPVAGPEDEVVSAVWLGEALDRLAPRQRAAVVLRHLGGLGLRDIADALGISVGTVKSTLHTAYARLRIDLGDDRDQEVVDDAR